jgi:hypothetical protein
MPFPALAGVPGAKPGHEAAGRGGQAGTPTAAGYTTSATGTDGQNRTMTMTTRQARPARLPALIRLARALRAMHHDQVYATECLLRLSQPPEADPLTWIRTRSGYHLAGRYLPFRSPGRPAATTAPDQ